MAESRRRNLLLVTAVIAIVLVAAIVAFIFLQQPPPQQPTAPAQQPGAPPQQQPVTQPTKPFHKQILYLIVNDEGTRINMYKTGVFDIAVVTPARWPDVNNTPVDGFSLHLVRRPDKPQLTIQYVGLNPMRAPLNITEVRYALAYAVPYDVILNQVFNKLYTRLYTIVPRGMPGYTEYGIVKFEYNMTKAKELIASLKAKGFDPSKYTITIIYNEGNTARQQIATLLQQSWSELGFKVTVEAYAWPKYLELVDNFQYDVMLLGWIPDYLDADNFLMPFVWGGAEFKNIEYASKVAAGDVGKYLAKVDEAIETEKFIVVVGPKGSGATYTGSTSKPLVVVAYEVDWEATNANWEKPVNMVTLGTGGLKDIILSALCKASQRILEPDAREAVIQAAVIKFNKASSLIMLGQLITGENYGSWVYGMYYPVGAVSTRYDLVWEDPKAPVVDTGVLGIKNNPETMVIGDIGWPDTFDPAKSYESFGWEIFEHTYRRLVTLWKEETEPIPDLAVAWAFSKDMTELYFVIRGNVVGYDPWNNKTYPIDATDVLFCIWRAVRANLPGGPQWMIDEFIDVNASTVLSEEELDSIARSQGLVTAFKGKSAEVHSLKDLLSFFGYSGSTAGVVKFKLKFPYVPILQIFPTGVGAIYPMEYALGDQYSAAIAASKNGKDPAAWAKFVQPGEDDPIHQLLAKKPVSTGPYYVADYKEDSYILLKYNPYYWNATLWKELYGFKP
ncbi:ABC transporter substrate-binding protein [Infirmifilum sp. SLHALR2]|nr:MAG: peptide transporter [Thermofilum sp. NZ13]